MPNDGDDLVSEWDHDTTNRTTERTYGPASFNSCHAALRSGKETNGIAASVTASLARQDKNCRRTDRNKIAADTN